MYYCVNTFFEKINQNWKTPAVQNLLRAFTILKTEKEMGDFLRDVATISEIDEMAKRLLAAQFLEKKISIREIAAKTGLSTTTVSRVSFWKKNGTGGYGHVLKKL